MSLSIDGRIVSRGSITDALLKDKKLLAEVEKVKAENAVEEQVIDQPSPDETVDTAPAEETRDKKVDGKLIVAEEIEEGHVSWSARASGISHVRQHTDYSVVNLYFNALGGLVFWIVFLLGFFGAEYVEIFGVVEVTLTAFQPTWRAPNVLPWLLGSSVRGRRGSARCASLQISGHLRRSSRLGLRHLLDRIRNLRLWSSSRVSFDP